MYDMLYFSSIFSIAFVCYLATLVVLKAVATRSRACPKCRQGKLSRVHKTQNDRILNALFFSVIKLKRYECNVCSHQTLRIKGAPKKAEEQGLRMQG